MTHGTASQDPNHGPRLVLAPASERGWFGGRGLLAHSAITVETNVPLSRAAHALQAAFDTEDRGVTAVLAAYDGSCTVVRFGQAQWNAGAPSDRATVQRPAAPVLDDCAPLLDRATWDVDGHAFRAGVESVRQRIARGDVYVLNLTARLEGHVAAALEPGTPGTAQRAFATLERRAGADMAALLDGLPGGVSWLASVSPERFVRITRTGDGSRVVEVCPIKGTAPRADQPPADSRQADALANDPKERAEHVMIVDLERNDLGVCCVPGTVEVDPLYEVVPTPYCHQMVSTVRGVMRADAMFEELLAATFPCGSVTGAPKVAAMRIIDELEKTPRGTYCGALLVATYGELDSSVLIRTLEADAHGERARWGAGCGITHDSIPAAEYLEMLLKASPVTGDGAPAIALRETMRVAPGRRIALLDRHLARLAAGGCGPAVLAAVRGAVDAALATVDPQQPYARLSLTVTPDGAVAAGVSTERSSLEVDGGPIVHPVCVERMPVLPTAAAKPASRIYWDKAHSAARLAGAHQAILHAPDGTLIDGSTANVWLWVAGELLTPPAPPAVAGVARDLVFDLCRQHEVPVREARLTLDDLMRADAVFLSNAVGGLVQARTTWSAPGHSTR